MSKRKEPQINPQVKLSNQLVGNAGLYYVCYELLKRHWNVLPTSRNAKGIDIVIYSQDAKLTKTIQVKTLRKRNPIPCGNNLDNLIAEYLIACRNVFSEKPEVFVMKIDDDKIKDKIAEKSKGGRISYWLQPKVYEEFRDKWAKIGDGFD